MDNCVNYKIPITNVESANNEDTTLDSLWCEYESILSELGKQGVKKDAVLLMRLTSVTFDLGIYNPSPP